jgi:hypothetical protein
MNDKKKLQILLDRWRDEMNGRLRRAMVDESPALCVSGAEPLASTPGDVPWDQGDLATKSARRQQRFTASTGFRQRRSPRTRTQ